MADDCRVQHEAGPRYGHAVLISRRGTNRGAAEDVRSRCHCVYGTAVWKAVSVGGSERRNTGRLHGWVGSARRLAVVVFVDVTELSALGGHLGEQTAPRRRPRRTRLSRRRRRHCSRRRRRLSHWLVLEMRLIAADAVTDDDSRSELLEVRLQLFLEAAPQHHPLYIHSSSSSLGRRVATIAPSLSENN